MHNERDWKVAKSEISQINNELNRHSSRKLFIDATVGILGIGTIVLGYSELVDHEQALIYAGAGVNGLSLADAASTALQHLTKIRAINMIRGKVEYRKTSQRLFGKEK